MDESDAQFFLRYANTAGVPDNQFVFGNPGDQPIAGRWNVTATNDGIGLFRKSNGLFLFRNALSSGYADDVMVFGVPGDQGLSGDWTGKGYNSPGVYRPATQQFLLTNSMCGFCSLYADIALQLGISGDQPFTGDWIGQGHSGAGVFRPSNGLVLLKNQLTTGYADIAFVYGIPNDVPIAGKWSASVSIWNNPPNFLVPATSMPANNSLGG